MPALARAGDQARRAWPKAAGRHRSEPAANADSSPPDGLGCANRGLLSWRRIRRSSNVCLRENPSEWQAAPSTQEHSVPIGRSGRIVVLGSIARHKMSSSKTFCSARPSMRNWHGVCRGYRCHGAKTSWRGAKIHDEGGCRLRAGDAGWGVVY